MIRRGVRIPHAALEALRKLVGYIFERLLYL
jgi:hypothetical protein